MITLSSYIIRTKRDNSITVEIGFVKGGDSDASVVASRRGWC